MRRPILIAAGLLLLIPMQAMAGSSYQEQLDLPADATYVGGESCLDCHDDVGEMYTHSPHSPGMALMVPGSAAESCEACHGPGSLHIEAEGDGNIIGLEALQAMDENMRVAMCLQCHTGQSHDWDTSDHVNSGISCADCHGDQVHFAVKATPAGDYRNQAEFCIQCHSNQVADFRMPSRHRVLEGQMSCNDCHDPHAGFEATGWNGLNDTCLECHTEVGGPYVFEHEAVTGEDCTACHKAHGSMHDKLLTQDGNTLCMQCHYGADFEGGFNIGGQAHAGLLGMEARCYDCHTAVHGSNVDHTFRN